MKMLNAQRLFASSTLIGIILGGCATSQPIPELSQPQSSGLGIDMTLMAPIGLFSAVPDDVYFVKIEGEGNLRQQQIVYSNFSKGGRVYLLNARPGSYVAVAASYLRPSGSTGSRFTTHFSMELVQQTQVTVRENDFVFMGSYVVKSSMWLRGTDGVLTNSMNVMLMANAGEYLYRGILLERKNDEETHKEFFRKAKEDLAGSGWAARLR